MNKKTFVPKVEAVGIYMIENVMTGKSAGNIEKSRV